MIIPLNIITLLALQSSPAPSSSNTGEVATSDSSFDRYYTDFSSQGHQDTTWLRHDDTPKISDQIAIPHNDRSHRPSCNGLANINSRVGIDFDSLPGGDVKNGTKVGSATLYSDFGTRIQSPRDAFPNVAQPFPERHVWSTYPFGDELEILLDREYDRVVWFMLYLVDGRAQEAALSVITSKGTFTAGLDAKWGHYGFSGIGPTKKFKFKLKGGIPTGILAIGQPLFD